jgi:phenylalanyl-tRNA synthetase beta chain
MKIVVSWLKQYVPVTQSAKEIAELLTSIGIEVDAIEEFAADAILEVSLTPNLGHVMSVLGVARELSAITGTPLKKQPWQTSLKPMEKTIEKSESIAISIEDPELCPRYSSALIKNVQVKPSPAWLQERLKRSGLHPVNNIVDITNLVSLELGQPMHAFDYDQLHGHQVFVRRAKRGEKLLLLDGVEKELPEGSIVIADHDRTLAVGGIMGGMHSSVTEKTKNILLESAFFSPQAIRRAYKALGLCTESAKRFERGSDPTQTVHALQYALELIQKEEPSATLTAFADKQMKEFVGKKISCRLSRASLVLGYEVSKNDAEKVFTRLGMPFVWESATTLVVTTPPFRHDITEEIDLIEEIGRILGLQRNTRKVQSKYTDSKLPHSPLFSFERLIRKRLMAAGLQEFVTCNLISPALADLVVGHPIQKESLVSVMNPTSIDQSILRPSMLPGLLEVVQRNLSFRNNDIAGFEAGRVYLQDKERYQEQPVFAIVMSGRASEHHFDTQDRDVDFFDLKGILTDLLSALGVVTYRFESSHLAIFHPGRQAKLISNNLQVGTLGELHPALTRKMGISARVLFAECNIQDLYALPKMERRFQELPQFPSSERDWTVTVPEKVQFVDIEKAYSVSPSPLCEQMELQSIFRSEKLGSDRKNVTLHFVFRDKEKTISQEEVEREFQRITASLSKAFSI